MTHRFIDMRLRPPIPEWISGPTFKTAMYYPRQVANFRGARSAWTESMDTLFQEMDSTGVRYGVVMGRAAAGKLGGVSNSAILNTLERWPNRFLGFLGVDLENVRDGVAELQELAGQPGVKGVSIEPGSNKTPLLADDPRLDPIYDFCEERGLPVSISLSGLLSALAGHDITWASPVAAQRVALRRPKLTIVMSHASWPYAHEMVAIALTCPNIFVSPDVYISKAHMPGARTYVDAANCFLADRTLWGTAYPSQSLEEGTHDFLAMDWNPAIVDKVAYGNAARLFGLEP